MNLSYLQLIKANTSKIQLIQPMIKPITKPAISTAIMLMIASLMTAPSLAENTPRTHNNPHNNTHKNWQDGKLIIEIVPVLCKNNPTYASYSQCRESRSYVIGGFDFQNNNTCYINSMPKLPPLQSRVVKRLIPDTKQQKDIWNKYAKCSQVKATDYFRQIIQQTNELHLPKVITSGNTRMTDTTSLKQQFINKNKGLSKDAIQLSCQNRKGQLPVLSKIAICYKNGKYGRCQKKIINTCGDQFIILGF